MTAASHIGKVASMWEMVNWCIRNPLEGKDLAADDPRMTAILACVTHERRGVKLEPGMTLLRNARSRAGRRRGARVAGRPTAGGAVPRAAAGGISAFGRSVVRWLRRVSLYPGAQ
ncbi:MAG: hypothetical protein MZV65_33745 [Chromatiales bacterium]|nr:hypothetical protein [Chromatiales bacterium]